MTQTPLRDQTAEAICATLMSPNVADSNLEPANVVDVLDRIAIGICRLADGVQSIADALKERP